jgi:PPK2 family polyphosphate:nucleotide phosphotransferase
MMSRMSTPRKLLAPYTITSDRFRLKDVDPDDTGGISSKNDAREALDADLERLRDLQEQLYARGTWSLLLIFQAMDAAGKDSTIEHVMSGVNPQGCDVHAFKTPSSLELRHDFLWRTTTALPERGRIGIFNRSYYEEVIVVRVHPEFVARQNIPAEVLSDDIWRERYEDIEAFERHLHRSGTKILKFFLHVSKREQRKRFLERLDEPDKYWKFSAGDLEERKLWPSYMDAYEQMIRNTATKHAPWFVVPADHKWFTRLVVAAAIVDALEAMDLKWPSLTPSQHKAIASARKTLASM